MKKSKGWILYVDDERGNRVVFEQTFAHRFPLLKTVSSGPEALAAMAEHDIAVLVADQRMPGMSGNELLAIARERSPERSNQWARLLLKMRKLDAFSGARRVNLSVRASVWFKSIWQRSSRTLVGKGLESFTQGSLPVFW